MRPAAGSHLCLLVLALVLAGAAIGCSTHATRFRLAEPVTRLDDMRPIPMPQLPSREQRRIVLPSTVSYPSTPLKYRSASRAAADVNSIDDTVASSFFTPRMIGGLRPDEVGAGPGDGPPQPPLVVEEIAEGGMELLARDARGHAFVIQLDAAGHPGLESAAAAVAARLLWAFGLNVLPQYAVALRRDDLATGTGVPATALESLLARGATDGARYRAGAVAVPPGFVLGPFSPTGVRKDDPNDTIPHEDRRALRSLHVLGAWLNLTDVSHDHRRDVYEGSPGQGFVRHYLASFTDALGASGADPRLEVERYEPYIGVGQAVRNLAGLGLVVQPWERLEPTPWADVGVFESQTLVFETWREGSGFVPIRHARPDDDYWAAKVLALLTPEHVRAAVEAGAFATPEAADYVVRTLLERQARILDAVFARVTPVEPAGFSPGVLRLRDLGANRAAAAGAPRRFEVRIQDGHGRDLQKMTVETSGAELVVASDLLRSGGPGDGYLRVVIAPATGGREAELHFRPDAGGPLRLVGVLH